MGRQQAYRVAVPKAERMHPNSGERVHTGQVTKERAEEKIEVKMIDKRIQRKNAPIRKKVVLFS